LRANSDATSEWRVVPFIAWAAGSVVAFFVSEYAPEYSTAIAAFLVAGVVYGVLQGVTAPRTQYAR
jgi:cytosine permease